DDLRPVAAQLLEERLDLLEDLAGLVAHVCAVVVGGDAGEVDGLAHLDGPVEVLALPVSLQHRCSLLAPPGANRGRAANRLTARPRGNASGTRSPWPNQRAAGPPQRLPRAATGTTASTVPSRWSTTSSTRLLTGQTWLGSTRSLSPTLGRESQALKSTTPCSSESSVITASGWSRTSP